MMLEETLIRESANSKLQQRVSGPIKVGPPVTFANPAPSKPSPSGSEESKDAFTDGLNDANFDVVQSPMMRRNTMATPGGAPKEKQKAMVPQEQYDALKARFIENETATQKKLESINDLKATITRRTEQMEQMELTYLKKLEDAQKELEDYKVQCLENEKMLANENKATREEMAREVARLEEHIERANTELKEVRDTRDTLIQDKNKLDANLDEQKNEIERLTTEVARAKDDVECRKQIIDEMSNSMLHHERESMEMALKLTLMKN